MSNMTKMLAVLVCLNIFMYVGVYFARSADGNVLNEDLKFYFEGDLLDRYLQQDSLKNVVDSTLDNWTTYDVQVSENATLEPTQTGGAVFGDGVSFIDSLSTVWAFVRTLFNIIGSPLALLFNFQMPVLLGIMIGIPYFMVLLFTIIAFIRGVGD